MNPFLAKNQPKREYTPRPQAELDRASRIIKLDFYNGEYTIYRDAGRDRVKVESGPMIESDDRKVHQEWTEALIDRVRGIAKSEGLKFSWGFGFSVAGHEDYR